MEVLQIIPTPPGWTCSHETYDSIADVLGLAVYVVDGEFKAHPIIKEGEDIRLVNIYKGVSRNTRPHTGLRHAAVLTANAPAHWKVAFGGGPIVERTVQYLAVRITRHEKLRVIPVCELYGGTLGFAYEINQHYEVFFDPKDEGIVAARHGIASWTKTHARE